MHTKSNHISLHAVPLHQKLTWFQGELQVYGLTQGQMVEFQTLLSNNTSGSEVQYGRRQHHTRVTRITGSQVNACPSIYIPSYTHIPNVHSTLPPSTDLQASLTLYLAKKYTMSPLGPPFQGTTSHSNLPTHIPPRRKYSTQALGQIPNESFYEPARHVNMIQSWQSYIKRNSEFMEDWQQVPS